MTARLASLLRSSLDAADRPLVPLEQEVQTVRDYLDIERVRFGDRMKGELAIDESAQATLVPRFSLQSLVENAVKYAPPETTISIDRQLVEGWVRIGITDQGPGVPEEWRERIFEPYARRDTHTARGSGIGLYAAKRLGESMGARLWCEPVDPTGARFVISLPAAAAV